MPFTGNVKATGRAVLFYLLLLKVGAKLTFGTIGQPICSDVHMNWSHRPELYCMDVFLYRQMALRCQMAPFNHISWMKPLFLLIILVFSTARWPLAGSRTIFRGLCEIYSIFWNTFCTTIFERIRSYEIENVFSAPRHAAISNTNSSAFWLDYSSLWLGIVALHAK